MVKEKYYRVGIQTPDGHISAKTMFGRAGAENYVKQSIESLVIGTKAYLYHGDALLSVSELKIVVHENRGDAQAFEPHEARLLQKRANAADDRARELDDQRKTLDALGNTDIDARKETLGL